MNIIEATSTHYHLLFSNPYHIFGAADFNKMNQGNCDKVYYLLFKDEKVRLGLIGGKKGSVFLSPFSAPYGGFSFVTDEIRIKYIEDALGSLDKWTQDIGLKSIVLTIPPSFYQNNFINKQTNCLFRNNYRISQIDLNYSFNLKEFDDSYSEKIWRNAKKNIRIALAAEMKIELCQDNEKKYITYNIIEQNRRERGFPLRMSWKQILETSDLIPCDFFLVSERNNRYIASAIVFEVTRDIVQVIYWGDLPEYNYLRTMNFLSYKLFEYYKNKGKKIIDIGPSSQYSVPNYGLGEFKESIGCQIHPKITFEKSF